MIQVPILELRCSFLCVQSTSDLPRHMILAFPKEISRKSFSVPTEHQQKKKFL